MSHPGWTPLRVRELLPPVQVRLGKKILSARVSGRLKAFATVTVTAWDVHPARPDPWQDWQVAWQTIAHCLNTNQPITLE